MQLTPDQLDELETADYGDPRTVKLDDGRAIRAEVDIDMDTTLDDYPDAYGTTARVERHEYRVGHAERPSDMNGNAEILWTMESGSESFWWQPPADGPKRGTPEFDHLRTLVSELATWGFKGVTLELLDEETDAYGRPIVRDVASLWGIDSLENGCLREVLTELASELDGEQ